MLNTIRENAKWFVAVPIVCFAALIFVDWGMSPGNGMTQKNVVGKVDGEKIAFEAFDKDVEAEAKRLTGEGQELDAGQYALIRAQVFEKFVRTILVGKQLAAYGLKGSPLEVLSFLKDNPPPGAEKAPIFMGPDSQFSRAKYLQWLSNPRVFDDPYMRMMEEEVTGQVVPEKQMTLLLTAAQPMSDLEIQFQAKLGRTRMWGAVVAAPADSFPVDPASVTSAQAKAWFDAHPDTLWHAKKAAVVPYVAFSKAPSQADSLQAKHQIDSVATLAHGGEKFEDLARNYSEDPGSAKQGGDLGGYQSLKRWVPEFAAAVRTLDSGKVSAPVLSRFGWHVIRCNGRKVEAGDTLYSLSHVLVTIQVTPETVDSLKAKAESFRKLVKAGKGTEEAAKAVGGQYGHSLPIEEGALSAALPFGVVPGLGNFAFREDATVSDVLENSKAVVVACRGKVYPAGRDFDLALPLVRGVVAREQASQKAKAWLEAQAARISACDTSVSCLNAIGKINGLAFSGRLRSSYVPDFGYAVPELLKLTRGGQRHAWAGVVALRAGALSAKVDSLAEPSPAELQQAVAAGRWLARNSRTSQALNGWYAWCRSLADVDNRLDRYFRD